MKESYRLEEIIPYYKKEILCIRDTIIEESDAHFQKGEYYKIVEIFCGNTGLFLQHFGDEELKKISSVIITLIHPQYITAISFRIDYFPANNIDEFTPYFEPITAPEVRQRKIESILK